jgi:hypothetical protein
MQIECKPIDFIPMRRRLHLFQSRISDKYSAQEKESFNSQRSIQNDLKEEAFG